MRLVVDELKEHEAKVVEQEKRHRQAMSLNREVKRLNLSPVPWNKPFAASAIQAVQDEVEAHAHRAISQI